MAYFGGGNTAGSGDPEGWVIADGTSRSNASDGRYNFIANILKIGTISGSNYTPPDLRGAFLRGGKRGATSGYGSYASDMPSGQPVSQTHATQTHTHGITDPGHVHNSKSAAVGGSSSTVSLRHMVYQVSGDYVYNNITEIKNNATNISINNSTTSVNDDETRPYNFAVNWIIKL
jgi:hypothetical protein